MLGLWILTLVPISSLLQKKSVKTKDQLENIRKNLENGANKSLSECILWCSWRPPRYVGTPSCDVSNRQEHQKQASNRIFSYRLLVRQLPLVRVVLLVLLVGASFPSLLWFFGPLALYPAYCHCPPRCIYDILQTFVINSI